MDDKNLSKEEKKIKEFRLLLLKLEEVEFLGVARLLGVQLFTDREEKDRFIPKDFWEILEEVEDAFSRAPRDKRRFLIRTLKKATKGKPNSIIKEDSNGTKPTR